MTKRGIIIGCHWGGWMRVSQASAVALSGLYLSSDWKESSEADITDLETWGRCPKDCTFKMWLWLCGSSCGELLSRAVRVAVQLLAKEWQNGKKLIRASWWMDWKMLKEKQKWNNPWGQGSQGRQFSVSQDHVADVFERKINQMLSVKDPRLNISESLLILSPQTAAAILGILV